MLDLFRKKGISSAVYGVVIVATVFVFVIQFNPSAGKKSASLTEACAVRVRGSCVEPKDHRAAFMLLVPVDEHGTRQTGAVKSMHLPELALNGLIERELLVQEAERIGLTASEDEVNDAIISGFLRVSIPADKPELEMSLQAPGGRKYVGYYFRNPKTKEFDEALYKRNLKNLVDRSPVEFREQQEREILAAKMRDLIRAPVRVSESEALETYVVEKSFAVLTYIELKPSFVARYALPATPEPELQKLVEEWASKSENAAIVASALETRKKEPIKDGNLRHILVKVGANDTAKQHADALAKITEAYARLSRGESFGDVARSLSDDSSKAKGGSIETEKADALPDGFRVAAEALKNGEMTHTAIESSLGYHVIMRDDASRLTKEVARELFYKFRLDTATRDLATKIGADMKAGKSADDALKAALAALKPILLVKVTVDKSLTHETADAGAAVSGDAGAVAIGDAGAATPAVKKELDPNQDEDRPQALTSASLRRGGDGLAHLAAEQTAKLFEFAFAAKDNQVLADPLPIEGGGQYLVALKEHKLASREEFDKDRDTYMQTLLRVRQNQAFAMYMKRLLDASRTDIKKDDAYMSQWTAKPDGGAAAAPEDEEPY